MTLDLRFKDGHKIPFSPSMRGQWHQGGRLHLRRQSQRTRVRGLYAAGDVMIGLDQISHAVGQAGVAATTVLTA